MGIGPRPTLSMRVEGRVELALAAVDDDQIGQRQRLVAAAGQVAGDDLVDRREIVLLAQPLDLELAVLALLRAAGLEPDQRAHGVPPLVVGDVHADQAPRHRAQPQVAARARRPDPRRAPRSRTTRCGGSRAGAGRCCRPARASGARCPAAGTVQSASGSSSRSASQSSRRERDHHPPRPAPRPARSSAPGTRSAPRRPPPPRAPREIGAPGPPRAPRAPG